MLSRRSLAFPLSLGIIMICLLVMLLIGWIIVTVYAGIRDSGSSIYWVLLPIGTVVLGCVLTGVALYLAISVKTHQVNRQQANFIDAVTHELKSPIAALKLGLETISRRQLAADDKEKFTAAMKKDIDRLDRLVSHLLEVAGLKIDRTRNDAETFDLRTLVETSVADVCTYHDCDPECVEVAGEGISYFGPILDFEIIFRNLIDNAVKYAGTPPRIEIRLSQSKSIAGSNRENEIEIRIVNNGASVPVAERKRVFERFERTGIELERTKPGVGLGLYIVRLLLLRNRGEIELGDPESGEGTEVFVRIPASTCGEMDGTDSKRIKT